MSSLEDFLRPLIPVPGFFVPDLPVRPDCAGVVAFYNQIVYRRTDGANKELIAFGELTIGNKTWPTAENARYPDSWPRKGKYILKIDKKNEGRQVNALRFWHDYISRVLIHDAKNDKPSTLSGCIAPAQSRNGDTITGSAAAMEEVWQALGGYAPGKYIPITIENNIWGAETARPWQKRRIGLGYPSGR